MMIVLNGETLFQKQLCRSINISHNFFVTFDSYWGTSVKVCWWMKFVYDVSGFLHLEHRVDFSAVEAVRAEY